MFQLVVIYRKLYEYISMINNNSSACWFILVAVDLTFCQAALQTKINIKEQLPKYLDGAVQLCILQESPGNL